MARLFIVVCPAKAVKKNALQKIIKLVATLKPFSQHKGNIIPIKVAPKYGNPVSTYNQKVKSANTQ
jgi:hypothetical protein